MSKIVKFLETNKITSFFLNRDVFSLVYITACILWFFPLLGWLMDPVCKLCFVWGAGLIFWDLFTKRRMFKTVYWAFPLLILLSFGMTILLNIQYSLYMGVKHAVYLGISLLILYGQDRRKTSDDLKKLLYRVNWIIIVIAFVAYSVSLCMYIFQISFVFQEELRQGFVENRLFGVFSSPNTGALFAVICAAAMMMNSIIKRNGKIRFCWFYIVNSVVLTLYFSLTLSNGGILTLTAFELLFVIVYFVPKLQLKIGLTKSILAGVLAAVVLLFGSNGVIQVVRYGMSYVPGLVNMLPNKNSSNSPEKQEPVEIERIEDNDDLSNGRIAIWTGSLKLWAQHPAFGYGSMMLEEEKNTPHKFDLGVLNEQETERMYAVKGNLHNAYIHILAHSGLIGFLLFGAFAVLLLKKVLPVLVKGRKDTWQYSLLAVLVVIILSICANGMVEAHLLYTRQDPDGAIFWLYIGITMVLAERFLHSSQFSKEQSENTPDQVFLCDTPYQVINAVNVVEHNENGSLHHADLYLYDQFQDAAQIAERLRSANLFSNVYLFRQYRQRGGLLGKLATLFRILLPERTLRRHSVDNIGNKHYKTIYVSFFTPFTDSVKLTYPEADVIQLEDGIGSYAIHELESFARTGLFRLVNKLILNGGLSYQPQALYLYHPQCYGETGRPLVRQLPALSDSKALETAFGYRENQLYQSHQCIYLTQPLSEKKDVAQAGETERKILELLPNALVRVHPRQDKAQYQQYSIDEYQNLWELECARQITSDHMLLGAFSTAQFVPKMLFDQEPTVVFLYELFGNIFENAEKTAEMLKGMYRQPEKVIVIKDFAQLKALFDNE